MFVFHTFIFVLFPWIFFSALLQQPLFCTAGELTGMNLHLTGRTAEQNAGAVLSNAIVGGRRLVLARTDAEAHLWHQRTRAGVVALKGGAVAVAQEELFVGLQWKRKGAGGLQFCFARFFFIFVS